MTKLEKYNILHSQLASTDAGETGSFCLPFFDDAIKITDCKEVLEIGFNRGASALKWLIDTNVNLTSVDIIKRQTSIDLLNKEFTGRFNFNLMNSKTINQKTEWINKFDLIFIDGDHSYQGVLDDLVASLQLKPKFLFFDDYHHGNHRQDILNAISLFPQLIFIKDYPPFANDVEASCGQGLYKVKYD